MVISEDNTPEAAASGTPKASNLIMDNKLKVAGLGQWVGDTALLAYGAATKNFKIGSVGLLGYTAGAIGLRYGNPKAEKQLEMVEHELGTYLRNQGLAIPGDPSMKALAQPGGVIDHVESFLYAYPTQLINTCFSLMGVQFARSGWQHNQKALLASGALLLSGGLAGLLIKEKNPDPDHPPQGVFQKAWGWVQEKPLRLTGILANLNQVSLVVDALQERSRNPGKNAYMFKLLAVAGFTLCNTMMALSSTGHGGGAQLDEETRNKLAEVAARVILTQPKKVQDSVLEHVAGFLATQPYVNKSAADISAMLRKKMTEVVATTPASGWQQRMDAAITEPRSL